MEFYIVSMFMSAGTMLLNCGAFRLEGARMDAKPGSYFQCDVFR